jgi:Ca2+-binding EF-hand superfamily protein
MMQEGGMMGGGMMGGGMMGQRPIPGTVMRIIFALMDSDGNGTVSLQEFQAAHERIFKAIDANKDGVLTLEEMQVFMGGQTSGQAGGPTRSGPRQ